MTAAAIIQASKKLKSLKPKGDLTGRTKAAGSASLAVSIPTGEAGNDDGVRLNVDPKTGRLVLEITVIERLPPGAIMTSDAIMAALRPATLARLAEVRSVAEVALAAVAREVRE